MKRRAAIVVPLIITIGLAATACGGSEDDDDAGSGGGGGTVEVSGSSTVEPISAIVAEEYTDADVNVDGPGTGDGFEQFCKGDTDISDASRPIEDEEKANCEAAGIEYVELKVAFDGMAVLTNANNDQAPECLSFADLYALIGPESEGVNNWKDAAAIAGELGSQTQFPDADLGLTGPGTESGTYDSFIEIALTGIAEERGLPEEQIETARPDYSSSRDDNVIIDNIKSSDTSLGWVGWSFAEAAIDSGEAKAIPISEEPGGECVEPSTDTIADESYPLSRSLYIYVNKAKAESSEALAGYVDFYLEDLSSWVEEALYVPLPDDLAEQTVQAWETR